MTTTIVSLVERVRDLLEDYGDRVTTLSTALSDTTGTSVTVGSSAGIKADAWLCIDHEVMAVTAVPSGPPYTLTVRRGQRGSTAATHLQAALVLVNPIYPTHRILSTLNSALGKMTKIVRDTTTLTFIDDTYVYAIPTTIDSVRRVEIENSDETNQFYVIRNWELVDGTYLRILGDYSNTRNIAVVGTSKFTAMSSTGNLDTTYPDDNANAINFLVYEAAGQLLFQRQGKIAGRDGFIGMTDAFAQSQPDHSTRIARQFLAEAERYRQLAIRQEPILQAPVSPTQDPTRSYLARV